jgi:hypothetical protein
MDHATLWKMKKDLLGKKCDAFVFGNGTTAKFIGKVSQIDSGLDNQLIIIVKHKKEDSTIIIRQPLSIERTNLENELAYGVYRNGETALLIGQLSKDNGKE